MGTKMSQREAVHGATHAVLKENKVSFDDGQDISKVMTDSMRASIIAIIVMGFKDGMIELANKPSNTEKITDDSKLRSYTSGLVSNWFRKDKRFNGNVTYVAKNPGSRQGIGDKELKALRGLRTQFEGVDAEKTKVIDAAIAKRQAELTVAKQKVTVDLSVLPKELIENLGLGSEEIDTTDQPSDENTSVDEQ